MSFIGPTALDPHVKLISVRPRGHIGTGLVHPCRCNLPDTHVLRGYRHAQPLGHIRELRLFGHVGVDSGGAAHMLVRLRQFA